MGQILEERAEVHQSFMCSYLLMDNMIASDMALVIWDGSGIDQSRETQIQILAVAVMLKRAVEFGHELTCICQLRLITTEANDWLEPVLGHHEPCRWSAITQSRLLSAPQKVNFP